MASLSGFYRAVLIVLLISMIPAAMSMWGDRLEISARVKTGESRVHITSYKALAFKEERSDRCITDDGSVVLSDRDRTMRVVFTEIRRGWYAWVGLVISNDGDFPKTVGKPSVAAPINISVSRFLYGPFNAPGNSGVWGNVDICLMTGNLRSSGNPFPGNMDRNSIYLWPSYKAISWIFLNYTGVDNLSSVAIIINIAG